MLTDYHMHLVDDDVPYDDDSFTLEHVGRYVTAAAAAGIDEIGFTDHVYRFAEARDWFDHALWQADAVGDLSRYHGAVSAARDAGLPVKVALEVDYLRGREQQIGEVVGRYRLGLPAGLGALGGRAGGGLGAGADLGSILRWTRSGASTARTSAWPRPAASTTRWPTPTWPRCSGSGRSEPQALYRQIADAFQAAGVCAEVSSAGYHQTLDELYPDPELLAMLHERGVPVTLGSDAHAPERVGRDFPRALAELHAAGYRTLTVFDRRERRQEVFDV